MIEVSHELRASYLTALAGLSLNGVLIPVADEVLPSTRQPATIGQGKAYVIIRDQQEVAADFNKCAHAQNCYITLDVITKFPKGSGGKITSELISKAIQNILVPKHGVLPIAGDLQITKIIKESSRGIIEHTETETAYRKIIIYLNKIIETN